MTPVAAPARVRDLLRTAPDGPVVVLHAGPLAVYVEVAGQAVGVIAAEAVRVPCALRTRLPGLAPDPRPRLDSGTLHLGDTPLRVGRTVATGVPALPPEVVRATGTSPRARPPLPDGPVDPAAVRRLVGRGDGLTPLGDDVLCGWLATMRAAAVRTDAVDAEVRRQLPRTTRLSATLLQCALAGETVPEHADWLRALGTPDAPARARALAALGASSGTGLLHGSRLALDQVREAA